MSCFTVNKLVSAVVPHRGGGGGQSQSHPCSPYKQKKKSKSRQSSPSVPRVEIVQEPPPTPLANNGGGLVVAIPHAHASPAPSPFPPHCYLPAAAFAGGGGGSVVSVASSSASLSSSPAPRHNNAMGFAGVGGCSPVPVRRQQQQHLQHLQHQAPPQMVNIVPPQAQQAICSLQLEVEDLRCRVRKTESERDYFESALNRMQLEKLRLLQSRDEQLESQSCRYEERLVELHSVIAELTRQLEQREADRIQEEEEEEVDEVTTVEEEQEVEAAEAVAATELDSRTSTDILDAEAVEAGKRMMEEEEEETEKFADSNSNRRRRSIPSKGRSPSQRRQQPSFADLSFLRLTAAGMVGASGEEEDEEEEELEEEEEDGERLSVSPSSADASGSFQALALQEELSDAKERNLRLQARLQRKESELEEARAAAEAAEGERERLRGRIREMEEEGKAEKTDKGVAESHLDDQNQVSSLGELGSLVPIPDPDEGGGDDFVGGGPSTALVARKLRELELELERVGSRAENLRAQNDILSLTLSESKCACEDLTVAIGRYESNHTAHQLAAQCTDQLVATLEVLLSLSEASCLPEGSPRRNKRAAAAAEASARRLLSRLEEASNRPDSGLSLPSAEGEEGNATTWWVATATADRKVAVEVEEEEEDSSGYSHTTNSSLDSKSSSDSENFRSGVDHRHQQKASLKPSRLVEARLRWFASRLKRSAASVRATVVAEMEGVHMERGREGIDKNASSSSGKEMTARAKNADLEMAVLVQELMSMREERCDLRARLFATEGEREALEAALDSQTAQAAALRARIAMDSSSDRRLDRDSEKNSSGPATGGKEETEQLLVAMEQFKRSADMQQKHNAEVINDLRKSNAALSENLQRTRRKYQTKLKKLEQQILQSLMKKQFGKSFTDINCHSVYSSLSTETDQTTD